MFLFCIIQCNRFVLMNKGSVYLSDKHSVSSENIENMNEFC